MLVPSAARAQDIYIVNQSSTVSAAEVADALPAFQDAVDLDFAPYWNVRAHLRFDAGSPPKGAIKVYLRDDTGLGGAAGYHYITKSGVPFGVVATGIGVNWQLVFTHELFELLADPHVNRIAGGFNSKTFYLVEVADPVEEQFYTRPSASGEDVQISDFVTESWFDGTPGKRDFLGLVKRQHQLLAGGYITIIHNGVWSQVFGKGAKRGTA